MSLNISTMVAESARRYPQQLAFKSESSEMSYAALWSRITRLADSLQKLGLTAGQHVALLLPNSPTFTIAYYAAHVCGLPVVPLNILLKADEIAYHLEDSEATVLVTTADLETEALAAWSRCPRLKHMIIEDSASGATGYDRPRGAQLHDLNTLLEAGRELDDIYATSPDDTAVILYTSGTTGRPKGAELSHFNLFYNAQYLLSLASELPPHHIRSLVALPLFHSFGQTVLQNSTLMAGGTLTLMRRFDPQLAAQLIESCQINVFAGVPTMYYGLLNHPSIEPQQLASLRLCLSGGASMPEEVMRRFDKKFGVDLIEAYGLSETSPVASCNPLGGGKKVGSVGVPIWGVSFRLIDESGAVITEPDTPGELCIKGHNVMKGYWRKPEATAEVLQNGWFRSGDIAMRDSEGFYRLVDRKKDLIIRGGFNIYPREIEEHLYAHPAVMEAAVVGMNHEEYGEEVHGFVVLRPGASCTELELYSYCKERLAAYKYPRHINLVEQLPKGPTGKILKRVLRTSSGAAL